MATNPTKQLRELLLWARREKIVLSHVQLGSLTVQVERDYGLVPPSGPPVAADRPRQSIYEQYAGSLLQDAKPTEAMEPTEEDD